MYNSILGSLVRRLNLKKFHVEGSVYLRGEFDAVNFKDQIKYVIDLNSNKYIHLGDVLFFLPIIAFLSKLKPVVIVAPVHKF
jgi:hypothetical protein